MELTALHEKEDAGHVGGADTFIRQVGYNVVTAHPFRGPWRPLPVIIGIRGDMGHGKDTLAAEICRLHPDVGYRTVKFATALRRAVQTITGIPAARTASDGDKAAPMPEKLYTAADLRMRVAAAVGEATGRDARPIEVTAIIKTLTGVDLEPRGEADHAQPRPGEGGKALSITPMTVGRFLQILGTECFRALVDSNVWVDALMRPWCEAGRPPTLVADTRFPNETAAIREVGGVVVLVVRRAAARVDGRSQGHGSERALDTEAPDAVIHNDGTLEDLAAAFETALPRLCELAAARTVALGPLSKDLTH